MYIYTYERNAMDELQAGYETPEKEIYKLVGGDGSERERREKSVESSTVNKYDQSISQESEREREKRLNQPSI